MPFKKGKSGNPNGKPPGAKNKTGIKLREMISNFLSDNFLLIVEDFHKLKPNERFKLYSDLLPFGISKLQSVSMDMQLEKLTEEQLNEIIETLKKSIPE